jgi:hypothetical protein
MASIIEALVANPPSAAAALQFAKNPPTAILGITSFAAARVAVLKRAAVLLQDRDTAVAYGRLYDHYRTCWNAFVVEPSTPAPSESPSAKSTEKASPTPKATPKAKTTPKPKTPGKGAAAKPAPPQNSAFENLTEPMVPNPGLLSADATARASWQKVRHLKKNSRPMPSPTPQTCTAGQDDSLMAANVWPPDVQRAFDKSPSLQQQVQNLLVGDNAEANKERASSLVLLAQNFIFHSTPGPDDALEAWEEQQQAAIQLAQSTQLSGRPAMMPMLGPFDLPTVLATLTAFNTNCAVAPNAEACFSTAQGVEKQVVAGYKQQYSCEFARQWWLPPLTVVLHPPASPPPSALGDPAAGPAFGGVPGC